MTYTLVCSDNLPYLKTLPDDSIDSIVTDPPYGLGKEPDALAMLKAWLDAGHYEVKGSGFMGKEWDAFVPQPALWKECLRVLKPGGHLLAFAGSRTQDLMGLSLRIAGFQIRDCVSWIYGSGFPKSLDVSKALDDQEGATRHIVSGTRGLSKWKEDAPAGFAIKDDGGLRQNYDKVNTLLAPATDLAKQWEGWGTALKPAYEPCILARKPLIGTVASNVTEYGTGAINVDACRVETADNLNGGAYSGELRQRPEYSSSDKNTGAVPLSRLNRGLGGRGSLLGDTREGAAAGMYQPGKKVEERGYQQPSGRWPANVVLDEVAAAMLDEQTEGNLQPSKGGYVRKHGASQFLGQMGAENTVDAPNGIHDRGGASRFFYTAKTSRKERQTSTDVVNNHPTVKPVSLMRWLVRLVTPPNGTVLDPFNGSGSTGVAALKEGFNYIGIEREQEYVTIAEARLKDASTEDGGEWDDVPDPPSESLPDETVSQAPIDFESLLE